MLQISSKNSLFEMLLWIHFFFKLLIICFTFYFIFVYFRNFRGSKNRGSMDPVHILMDPVHGPGPRRGSMDQGSMFCSFQFAMTLFFLPWGFSFCREVNSFPVTVVGHRTTYPALKFYSRRFLIFQHVSIPAWEVAQTLLIWLAFKP